MINKLELFFLLKIKNEDRVPPQHSAAPVLHLQSSAYMASRGHPRAEPGLPARQIVDRIQAGGRPIGYLCDT